MFYQSISNPQTYDRLCARLAQLSPESPRQWGTLTPAEVLTHLADSHDVALGTRPAPGAAPSGPPRPIVKLVALYLPMRWPRGLKTLASVDPRRGGTPTTEFARDRERVLSGLRDIANANNGSLSPEHIMFGAMSRANWQRWAYLHADHHLRQFGL